MDSQHALNAKTGKWGDASPVKEIIAQISGLVKTLDYSSLTHFQDQGGIEIGDGTLIGHNVVLATINHDLSPKENRKNHYAPIKIGAHVWIGSNATILPGVTLGDWAVVAAGAVVARDVPAMTVVGGVPAKVLRVVQEGKEERYETAV